MRSSPKTSASPAWGLAAAAVIAWASPAPAQQVTIAGGQDPANRFDYHWTVVNEGHQAIKKLVFPQFRGIMSFRPDGWNDEWYGTNDHKPLVKVGGTCTFIAAGDADMLRQGQRAEFGVRLAQHFGGGQPTPCDVTVVFEDDTTVVVAGIECPQFESWFDRHVPLLGGVVVVVILAISRLRRRRAPTPPAGADA